MSDELIDEIQNMLGGETAAPSTESPGTDAPGSDAPTTDAPAVETDAPETDAPATDAVVTDAPTTDAPELDDKDAKIAALQEQLADLAGKVKLATAAPSTGMPTTDAPPQVIDFLGDRGVDDVTGDRETFNALLNEVVRRVVEVAGSSVSETVLRAIPEIVKHNVNQHSALKAMTEDFYKENSDLVDHKKFVGMIGAEVASKNPDWTIQKVFGEAAVETRKRLKMKPVPVGKPSTKKPALPGGSKAPKKGAPKQKPGLAKDIDDMMKTVD